MDAKNVKPYMLVVVNEDGYSYIGQVMGFVDPSDGRAMVRRAPGHSGTLDAQPPSALEPVEDSSRLKFVHYARVKGRGSFPVDMLRREWAAPVNFRLISTDDRSDIVVWTDDSLGEGFVIASVSERKFPMWNVDRWLSFGWSLEEMKSLAITEGL